MRVTTGVTYRDWHGLGAAAQQAEADGFDGLTCPELANEPFAPLAIAALATERVELATSVAIAFPRSPMVVAMQAWELNVASRGRFVLGLGTQVKPHNERRFSVPWIAPAERLGEYVQALRAIWRCWEHGEKLDFRGKHYNFTLMTPEFSPGPSGLRPIPVMIAAVGPLMQKTAARLCDGVRLHGFATRAYIEQVVRPLLAAELKAAGKQFRHFEVTGGGFIVTGPNDKAVAEAAEKIRYRVAFYGSTPAYRGVFDLHGLSELGVALHEASRRGEWDKMAAMVPDEVLELFCARATYDRLPRAVEARFGGIVDTVGIDFLPGDDAATRARVIASLRELPQSYLGPASGT